MSTLGKELAQLHLNYESLEINQELRILYESDLANAPDAHRVAKCNLKKARTASFTMSTLALTISPARLGNTRYVVNRRSNST